MYCYLYEGIQQSLSKLQYKPVVMTSSFFFLFADGEKSCASCVVSAESPVQLFT